MGYEYPDDGRMGTQLSFFFTFPFELIKPKKQKSRKGATLPYPRPPRISSSKRWGSLFEGMSEEVAKEVIDKRIRFEYRRLDRRDLRRMAFDLREMFREHYGYPLKRRKKENV